MMKRIFYILLAVAALAGCYRDKGDYDYITLSEIQIDGINESQYYYLSLGERFTMPEPVISFKDSTYAHDDLSYEWKIDNKVVSTEKKLDIELALKPKFTYYTGTFSVKDNRSGVSFLKKFKVSVTATFARGWVWLAENGGRTEMNMITEFNRKFYPDLFTKANGAELGAEGYRLVEHFANSGWFWYSGLLIVAGANSIEVDHFDMTKEAWMYQEFNGGHLPEGFNPVASAFTKHYSCVVGDNGKVHVRHAPGGYIYEGRYPSIPYYCPYRISPKLAQAYPPNYDMVIMFDENTSSYVYLDKKGEIKPLADVEDQGGAFPVKDMNKDLVYFTSCAQRGNTSTFYAVVRDRTSGRYSAQQFEFSLSGRVPVLNTISETGFGSLVDAGSLHAVSYRKDNAWFTKGNTLYSWNRTTGEAPKVHKQFDGEIAAFSFSISGRDYAVAVRHGDTYDLIWETVGGDELARQTGLKGEVKDLLFKEDYTMNF